MSQISIKTGVSPPKIGVFVLQNEKIHPQNEKIHPQNGACRPRCVQPPIGGDPTQKGGFWAQTGGFRHPEGRAASEEP